jgi:hypothetical protein
MGYTLLVFEPDIKQHPSAENVLWKGQVIPPSNFSSIMLILLQDILELNNIPLINLGAGIRLTF